jgi:hypothetical protein
MGSGEAEIGQEKENAGGTGIIEKVDLQLSGHESRGRS